MHTHSGRSAGGALGGGAGPTGNLNEALIDAPSKADKALSVTVVEF